ncbi:MAG: non-heme iron oxygenase ferredoxin subunit [Chloroflexi bacterium]|nr:non-heme iron oxygenase ferredoxin subunit [Chloroflexota bacterium]
MAELVKVTRVGDVAPGQAKVVQVNGKEIALCNVGGSLYAVDNICTHDGGSLDQGRLEWNVIECPRHGAQFDVRSGKALCLPAVLPVTTYRVVVQGDDIEVAAS